MKILTLASLLVLPILLLAQDNKPKLPAFPQRTEATLYEQLGSCTADLRDIQKWAQSLTQEIAARDKEIEALKAQLAAK